LNILIDIGHPGHVHLYRNLIKELISSDYQVYVTVKDIPAAKQLLTNYGIDFFEIGKKRDSLLLKGLNQFSYNYDVFRFVKKNKIKLGIGSSITLPHISKVTSMKSMVFDDDDDEVEPLFVKYAHPFCDYLFSPDVLFQKRKKKNTIYYPGYHELAYLHLNQFSPDEKVLKEAGIEKGEPYFIMRFNVFKAHHDIGIRGLSLEQKLNIIEVLKPYGKIFITTERESEPELQPYKLIVSPEKVHSLMAFSTMFLGDSQTMTSEAAVMGIPSFRCNSFVGRISYLEEEEHKYGLTFGYKPENFGQMLIKIEELLKTPRLKEKWQNKRMNLLQDKIDVTAFMVWLVKNFPGSIDSLKGNPDIYSKFK
jgi:predicted glycosyltransferase